MSVGETEVCVQILPEEKKPLCLVRNFEPKEFCAFQVPLIFPVPDLKLTQFGAAESEAVCKIIAFKKLLLFNNFCVLEPRRMCLLFWEVPGFAFLLNSFFNFKIAKSFFICTKKMHQNLDSTGFGTAKNESSNFHSFFLSLSRRAATASLFGKFLPENYSE